MRRREFLGTIGRAAIVLPLAPQTALPQSSGRKPRIGVLWHAGNEEEEGENFTALVEGFRNRGYVDGPTATLEHRYANEQYERFQALAAELVSLKVDILVAVTRMAAAAAQTATNTIPIVFVVVQDPVANRFADSLARPGRNMTGLGP